MHKKTTTLAAIALLSASALAAYAQNNIPTQDPKKGTYGYTDATGKWIVKPKYQVAEPYRTLPSGVEAAFVKENDREGYLDTKGSPLGAGITFASIDSISPEAAIVKVKDKYGVVSWTMDYILKPEYNAIEHLNGRHFKIVAKNKTGLMNDKGEILLPAEYSDIIKGDNEWYKVAKNGKTGYFDVASANLLVDPVYEDVRKMIKINNVAYFPVSKSSGVWGLVKENGAKALDFKYQDIQPVDGQNFLIIALNGLGSQLYFPEKNAMLKYTPEKKQELDGFMMVKGKVDAPPTTSPVEYDLYTLKFPQGYYSTVSTPDGKTISKYIDPNVVKLPAQELYLVQTGTEEFDLYDANHSLLATDIKGKPDSNIQQGWIVFSNFAIDTHGKIYDAISEDGYAVVKGEDKKWHYLKKGKISEDGFDEVSMGFTTLHTVKNNGRYGIVSGGNLIFPCTADDTFTLFPNVDLLMTMVDGKPILLDFNGKIIAESGTYDEINGTAYNVLTVKKNGKTGIISADGTVYVPAEFDDVDIFPRFYLTKRGGLYGVYSLDNKETLVPQFDGIYSSQDDNGNSTDEYYWAKKGEKWGVLTPYGKQIVPPVYPTTHLFVESNVVKATDTTGKTTYYQLDGTKLDGKREVKLTQLTMDHNVYDKNGNKCFKLNFNFDTRFLNKDQEQVYVMAKVYTANGQPARKANGQPIEWGYWVEPSYLFTSFSNQYFTFPYAQFSQGRGSKEYYVKLTFQDESGRTLPLSGNNKINFTLTR